jgi:hypothetical protein
MISKPANPPVLQDHDALRKKFRKKADSIVDGLESISQALQLVFVMATIGDRSYV